jgi:hypothetical protein
MKLCVYCGKEYPDDATECPVDQQPVTSDGRPVPAPKKAAKKHRSDLEIRAHLAARPRTVKFGVGFLALDTVIGVIRGITAYHPDLSSDPEFYFSTIFTFVMPLIILYFIFQGKNWARWLTVSLLVLGTIAPIPLHYRVHLSFYISTLLDFVAAAVLFERSSNEWFVPRTED